MMSRPSDKEPGELSGLGPRTDTEWTSALIETGSHDADDMHREPFEGDERTSAGVSPKLDHGVTGRSCVFESGIAARQAADEVDIVALFHV